MPTSINRNSKPDTVLLALPEKAGAAALATDVSQYRVNLTNNTTYVSEANSARTAIDSPREIAVVVDVRSTDSGVILNHGNAGIYGYRIVISSGGNVSLREAGNVRATATIPGLTGSARKCLIHWSQRPDGSDVRHELLVYNFITTKWAHGYGSATGTATSATDTLTIGASLAGASTWTGGVGSFYSVRIGRRHHAQAEAREDWISETTPPATTQTRRGAPLVPARGSLDIGADGSFAGPSHLWPGHAFEQADRRLVGPLLNLRVRDPDGLDNVYSPNSWFRLAPGETVYHMPVNYLAYRPVPAKCNRARVRIYVSQAATGEPLSCPVQWRYYSIAGLPCIGEAPGPLTYYRTATVELEANHGAGEGEWLDLGALPLAVDDWGCTYLALAVSFDGDSYTELADLTYARVRAVTIDPYFEPAGGGLDIMEP